MSVQNILLLLHVYQSYMTLLEKVLVMCCVVILAVLLLATSLPQHEAITDKTAHHSSFVEEANAVAKINNSNFCLP